MSAICIISGIYPPDIGGPSTFANNLVKSLEDCRFIVFTYGECSSIRKCRTARVFVLSRNINIFFRELIAFTILPILIFKTNYVIICGNYNKGIFWCRLLNKKYLVRIVGDDVWERAKNRRWTLSSIENYMDSPNYKIRLLHKFRVYMLNLGGVKVVPSNYTRQMVAKWGVDESKIKVIYNPVRQSSVNMPSKKKFTGIIKLITTSRLVGLKRVDKLIEMLTYLSPNYIISIIGDGPEKDKLEAMARVLEVDDRVIFHGALAPEDITKLLNTSDLFVMYSETENFPHSVIEAMAMGLPVICTNVGGTPEVVRDRLNGILVERDDFHGFIKAIQELSSNPKLYDYLSKNAYNDTRIYSSNHSENLYYRLLKDQ